MSNQQQTALEAVEHVLTDPSAPYVHHWIPGSYRDIRDRLAALIERREREAKIEALEWAIEQECPGIDTVEVFYTEIDRLKAPAREHSPAQSAAEGQMLPSGNAKGEPNA